MTIASAEDVTCRFRQQGTPEEEDCWAALMAAKVRAARSSPYDITLLLDTDVFGNPAHPLRLGLADALKQRMVQGGIDLFGAEELSYAAYRGDFTQRMNFGMVNGGYISLPLELDTGTTSATRPILATAMCSAQLVDLPQVGHHRPLLRVLRALHGASAAQG